MTNNTDQICQSFIILYTHVTEHDTKGLCIRLIFPLFCWACMLFPALPLITLIKWGICRSCPYNHKPILFIMYQCYWSNWSLIAKLNGVWVLAAEVGRIITHSAQSFSHKVQRFRLDDFQTEALLISLYTTFTSFSYSSWNRMYKWSCIPFISFPLQSKTRF